MKKYPEIEVLTRGAQKRGGAKLRPAVKASFLVQVTAQTQVKCGAVFTVTDRVKHSEVDDKKRRFRESVRMQASNHVAKCKECNK